jgi:hypothetical protein
MQLTHWYKSGIDINYLSRYMIVANAAVHAHVGPCTSWYITECPAAITASTAMHKTILNVYVESVLSISI